MKTLKLLGAVLALSLLVGCSEDMDGYAESASPASAPTEKGTPSLVSNNDEVDQSVLLKNRFVIRTARLTVKVENVEKAEQLAEGVVSKAGGFVASGTTDGLGSRSPIMVMTARVPVETFESTLGSLTGLGVLQDKSISSDDVTGQIVDLDARLKTLRAKEEVYVNMMRKVSKTSDVIELQNTLTSTRTEIEQIQGQRQNLAGQAKFSTIELTLTQEASVVPAEKDQNWSAAAWTESQSAFGGFVRTVGTMGIWFLTFAPLWVVLGAVVAGLVWLSKRATAKAPTRTG